MEIMLSQSILISTIFCDCSLILNSPQSGYYCTRRYAWQGSMGFDRIETGSNSSSCGTWKNDHQGEMSDGTKAFVKHLRNVLSLIKSFCIGDTRLWARRLRFDTLPRMRTQSGRFTWKNSGRKCYIQVVIHYVSLGILLGSSSLLLFLGGMYRRF